MPLRNLRMRDPEPGPAPRGTAHAPPVVMAVMLRSLHDLAFGLAFLGAAACSSESGSDTARGDQQQNQITDDPRESSDPGEDENASEPTEYEPSSSEPLEPATCSVTYTKHILPRIQEQWRCGASACHANPGGHAPIMDTKNADATYTLFTSYVYAKTGKKLIDTKSKVPAASSLHCLMRGTCGDNRRMPYQGVSEADLTVLEAWLKCGAPR